MNLGKYARVALLYATDLGTRRSLTEPAFVERHESSNDTRPTKDRLPATAFFSSAPARSFEPQWWIAVEAE